MPQSESTESPQLSEAIGKAIGKLALLESEKITKDDFENILNQTRDKRDKAYAVMVQLRELKKTEEMPLATDTLQQLIKTHEAEVKYLEGIYRHRSAMDSWQPEPSHQAVENRSGKADLVRVHFPVSNVNKDVPSMKEDLRRLQETKFMGLMSVMGVEDLEDLEQDLQEDLSGFNKQLLAQKDTGEHEKKDLPDRISLTKWKLEQVDAELARRENDETVEDKPRVVG